MFANKINLMKYEQFVNPLANEVTIFSSKSCGAAVAMAAANKNDRKSQLLRNVDTNNMANTQYAN